MGSFVNLLQRVVSSDTLTAGDCQVGDVLVNAANGAAVVIAQNVTTGAPEPVTVGATSSLTYDALKASAPVVPGRFLEISGVLLAKHVGAAGGAAGAVSLAAAAPGAPIRSVVFGLALVEAGGLVNAGDRVSSDNQGRAIQATATAVDGAGPALKGSQVLGIALQNAIGPGSFILVLFQPGGLFPATVV